MLNRNLQSCLVRCWIILYPNGHKTALNFFIVNYFSSFFLTNHRHQFNPNNLITRMSRKRNSFVRDDLVENKKYL